MNKRKIPKAKKDVWFVPVRGSYLPASFEGWLTYVPFIFYLLFVWVVAMHEVSNDALALLLIVPNWVAATAIMTYVASRNS